MAIPSLCYSARVRTSSRALLLAILGACSPPAPTPLHVEVPVPPPAPTTITVRAAAPGLGASALEHDITTPLENALASTPGLTQLRSESSRDTATLVLTLAPGTVVDLARAAVYERLSSARPSLPADINPTIEPELAPHADAVHFIIAGDRPGTELRAIAQQLRDDLIATAGVATIELCGGREPQLRIVVDPARQSALAVSVETIATSLRTSLTDDPALAPGLHLRASARSIDDLSNLVVKPGSPAVTLGDLAHISLDTSVPACDAMHLAGGTVVLGTVVPLRTAPSDFTNTVQARLAALRSTLPADLELRTPTLDRVALELLATAPAEALPLAARAIHGALASPHQGYLQAQTHVAPGAQLELLLLLEPANPDPTALAAALATVPGLRVRAIDGGLGGLTRVIVLGDETQTLVRIAEELASVARKLPGTRSADVRWALDPELALDLQRDSLARMGIPASTLHTVLAAAIGGVPVGHIAQAGQHLPVQLQLGALPTDPSARVAGLRALSLPTASGSVPLSELVDFRQDSQPHALVRIDRRRAVEIELQLTDPTAHETLRAAVAAELRLPPGYVVRFE